jgi:isoleucyl-tRNA synthetase
MYKLNLFKTDFELANKHTDKSAAHALWHDPAVVAHLHRNAGARPTFLLHDGPPYANGSLHLGHFVNKSLKDALLKFKRLQGYFAPFVPGFDCHGLPVELEVEKRGQAKTDPEAFVAACRAYATTQVAQQTQEFQSFGVSADWDAAYTTMAPGYEAAAARYFTQLSHVTRRLRPVHWCAACGSSLAEAEVEYKPRRSDSVVVLFELVDMPNTFLQVWTTTPYTLPANKAVAFNASLDYVKVPDGARHLVRARREDDSPSLPSVQLAGRQAVSPYTSQHVPVVTADYVTSAGTGLVHLAPAFGLDDFRVGEQYGLAVESFVDDRGRFLAGVLQGQSLAEARKTVLSELETKCLLYAHDSLEHEYPHCWRHKTPLFFKASEEWFMGLEELAPKAVQALDAVTFVPNTGRGRLESMLASRSSWCLSRTRLWGTPLANREDPAQMAKLDDVAREGVEAWQRGAPERTLDVWFDSGVTHAMVMNARFGRTADLVLEGSDQHRGWFQSSLLTAVATTGEAPYKTVLTHGFVVDENGHKYSKSSANYEPLAKMFQRYSPDVLRLWALSQDYTRDLKMSSQAVDRTVERYRKLRNTLRFCLQNTVDFRPEHQVPVTASLHLAQLEELSLLVTDVLSASEAFDFAAVTSRLAEYCEQVSGEYFTAVKDALYCEAAEAPRRRQVQVVLSRMLEVLVRLLVPVLPYTAEETYQVLRSRGAVGPLCSLQLTLVELPAAPATQWRRVYEALRPLRQAVHRQVEAERDETLKGPAQLELTVALPHTVDVADLEDFFDCAAVQLRPGPAEVSAVRTLLPRCPRCRRHRQLSLTDLCNRCSEVEASRAKALA